MGLFDWLFGKRYDKVSALNYIRANPKFLKRIQPEIRSVFQKNFTNLIAKEIEKQNRNLTEKEIETIANAILLRLKIPKEEIKKDRINASKILYVLEKINNDLLKSLYEAERSAPTPMDITTVIKKLTSSLKQYRSELQYLNRGETKLVFNENLVPTLINQEIQMITELISNLNPTIPRAQTILQIRKARIAITKVNDNLVSKLNARAA